MTENVLIPTLIAMICIIILFIIIKATGFDTWIKKRNMKERE